MPPTQEKKITISKKSPERCQQFKRSRSQSSSFDYDAEKHHQLKKSRSHLQRKVLKDATNSGKEDHDLQRKVLKDAWQFKRS